MNPTALVAYLALFATVGLLFVFAALLLGRFLRAHAPNPTKLEVYECGETPIGPGFVQFDLRFYVVALLFIVFEVEVAFFFPWATVFGKAAQLRAVAATSQTADNTLHELGVYSPEVAAPSHTDPTQLQQSARNLARMAMVDIAVFFGVLLLGFAYLWTKGDLNWVRASSDTASTSGPVHMFNPTPAGTLQQDEP